MKISTKAAIGAFALTMTGLPALAQDAENGATVFQRQCQNCHNVVDDSGEVLAGRPNMRTGPNLYGVIGRQAGVVEGFRYGADLVAAGAEAGLVWSEEAITTYVQDPRSYLQEVTGNNRARSQMAFQVRSESDAADVAAYLATFGAQEEPAG
ncbi:c-type cytochrome [Roseibaca sp. Y0-43]|uniref:c-type cytochrome n=1 Tax=Roseibaca sp. Y0-43 TaxID=2816854 RepID=UPI001D0CC5C9|nr:c-type cytochrome [Roseibaca sp. Y0-43]MCC1482188.1 c-type cytochrome [Roseibaca sp. Y0-43]